MVVQIPEAAHQLVGVVNGQASANAQLNQGPQAIDTILSGITEALRYYKY